MWGFMQMARDAIIRAYQQGALDKRLGKPPSPPSAKSLRKAYMNGYNNG